MKAMCFEAGIACVPIWVQRTHPQRDGRAS